jgi:hypothetical protein
LEVHDGALVRHQVDQVQLVFGLIRGHLLLIIVPRPLALCTLFLVFAALLTGFRVLGRGQEPYFVLVVCEVLGLLLLGRGQLDTLEAVLAGSGLLEALAAVPFEFMAHVAF